MSRQSDWQDQQYARGHCIICGHAVNEPDNPKTGWPFRRCAICRDRQAAARAAQRKASQLKGMCTRCQKRPLVNAACCEVCRQYHNVMQNRRKGLDKSRRIAENPTP